ncbi:Protein of unknown function [Cnuella takakiae]|uniref:Murein DD-endopeptidase MepM and murein hydrolase activator NlpD, contain LysM domain n=1 Tax=Cnuella takakiae TaxID=1302690 RepID=A0A1M5GUW9_9BACT|nr:peptidoglycan DD-metalloendopeptidase family protein [Cnuella takakiae]OLY94613.1 peptidase M23 [Cnuella takakiae]SHG07546.1 Protein of unknown function [Cnuella takakiae]
MRNLLLCIISLFANQILSAQNSQTQNQQVAARFEMLYNAGRYDSIFALFTAQMKQALPADKTVAFLQGLNKQAGTIQSREFVRHRAGFDEYKTRFEKALFSLNIAVDDSSRISGLLVRPFTESSLPKMKRNLSPLALPFKEEWTVVWGGDTKEQNYHVESPAQQHAFDLVIKDSAGKSHRNKGASNADYYAFGKPLYAPADGEVVQVVDGIPDNTPGTLNPIYVPGNTVIIKTAREEYLFFAHFQQHTIKVRQGQKVKAEQLLGLCGNSGNSSEPHLHFHVQNTADMNVATGVKCYFNKLLVNGTVKEDYSPIQGERIKLAGK